MTIVHIERPADLGRSAFEVFMPSPVGDLPRPTLGSVEAWAAPDGAVETGTWEAHGRGLSAQVASECLPPLRRKGGGNGEAHAVSTGGNRR